MLQRQEHITTQRVEYSGEGAQVVTNLHQTCYKIVSTSRHHVVFALLVPDLLASCFKPETDLLQACSNNLLLLSSSSTTCY
jgi:hypothetical protein